MKKLESFKFDKFMVKNETTFQIKGGVDPKISATGTTWVTDKVDACGDTECGGDTEFEHKDTCITY